MDIQNIRDEINELDEKLVELFVRRMHLARAVAEYKKEHDLPVTDRTREREVLHRLTGEVTPEFQVYTKSLYQKLFELSKTYQSALLSSESALVKQIRASIETTPRLLPARAKVACQGTEGAYSQLACDRIFQTPSVEFFDSFDAVFRAVDSGLCHYGILPIENSTAGSVTSVYELMQKYRFYIVGGTRLCVGHTLMAPCGTRLSDVREVISHEQALSQCSDYLKGMEGVRITRAKNTALAAKELAASERHDAAVICSADCAELYGLCVLESSVANTENNHTRFICIAKEPEIYPGANRTSLMVRLPHKPGALYGLLARFDALGINLTKIESRPIAGTDFEFMFYFDIDASVYDDALLALLAQLEAEMSGLTYLGSYYEC